MKKHNEMSVKGCTISVQSCYVSKNCLYANLWFSNGKDVISTCAEVWLSRDSFDGVEFDTTKSNYSRLEEMKMFVKSNFDDILQLIIVLLDKEDLKLLDKLDGFTRELSNYSPKDYSIVVDGVKIIITNSNIAYNGDALSIDVGMADVLSNGECDIFQSCNVFINGNRDKSKTYNYIVEKRPGLVMRFIAIFEKNFQDILCLALSTLSDNELSKIRKSGGFDNEIVQFDEGNRRYVQLNLV